MPRPHVSPDSIRISYIEDSAISEALQEIANQRRIPKSLLIREATARLVLEVESSGLSLNARKKRPSTTQRK